MKFKISGLGIGLQSIYLTIQKCCCDQAWNNKGRISKAAFTHKEQLIALQKICWQNVL